MARMRTRYKKDTNIRVVAMPTFADAETLVGLTVPVDPDLIHRLPRLYRSADLSLTVCIIGLLLLGRETCPVETLARLCNIPRRDLKVALARVEGRTDDGRPKYFTAKLRGQKVVIGAVQTRLTRPDRYVRLPVETLANAPTAAYARYFVLAAEAAMGDEQRGRNEASRSLAKLGMTNTSELDGAHAWAGKILRESLGRHINYQFDRDDVIVTSLNSCHWNYDYRAAPLPWTDEDYWKNTMFRAKDGHWNGHELTVDHVRAAKVCAWVEKIGCKLGARNLRIHWLIALHQALVNEHNPEADRTILNDVEVHGATAAFERWVISVAGQNLGAPNFKMADLADEHRVMRTFAAKDPGDRRLRPYATHPYSGEQLCQYQFWRRIVRPLQAQGLPSNDYRYALRYQFQQYGVGGRTPYRPDYQNRPSVISFAALQQVGVKAMIASYPPHYQPAVDLVTSMVTQGLRRGVRTVDEAIEGMLDDVRRSSRYEQIAGAWRKAVVGVQEEKISGETALLETLAVQIFKECAEMASSVNTP